MDILLQRYNVYNRVVIARSNQPNQRIRQLWFKPLFVVLYNEQHEHHIFIFKNFTFYFWYCSFYVFPTGQESEKIYSFS